MAEAAAPPRDPSEVVLSVERVSKRFGGLRALHEVSFDVRASEVFGVIGPNGAGKTTLFSCLVGATRPTSGAIRFLGERIDGRRPYDIVALGVVRTHHRAVERHVPLDDARPKRDGRSRDGDPSLVA
jgi:ABC-type branched-subunit amino acid transport system ATPase component